MNIGKIPAKTARLDPEREALIDVPNQRRMSYGELDERVRRLANAMIGELGLEKGDRVAILSKNCIEYMEIYYACARCGMIAQPLNWRLGEEEMARILRDGEPSVVVVSAEYGELQEQLLPAVPPAVHRTRRRPPPPRARHRAGCGPSPPPRGAS